MRVKLSVWCVDYVYFFMNDLSNQVKRESSYFSKNNQESFHLFTLNATKYQNRMIVLKIFLFAKKSQTFLSKKKINLF